MYLGMCATLDMLCSSRSHLEDVKRQARVVYVVCNPIVTCKTDTILGPVVQSIVSLTISLRHKFVKQISAKVTNTLLFFVEKM